jgi:hypothetical protein
VKLFDDKPRDSLAPKENGQHPFEYADRSARPEAAGVREFVERAFSYYPAERQAELAARLRSEGYRSGSFELILHELLRRRDLPLEIEAQKADTTKRPDFLVGTGAESFYMEAILATEESPSRVAERKRCGVLVDVVNRMQSDNFFVGFEVEASGTAQPSAKAITSYLTFKLAGLDADDDSIWNGLEGFESPAWVWEDQGWRIVFRPMPKKVEARGRPGRRAVGMIIDGLRAMSTDEAIRDAVGKKATKYGPMDRPYVVAVNVLTWPLDEIDCIEALYGTVDSFDSTPGGGTRVVRRPNGILGPTWNTRVSAIAFFEDVEPWTASKRDAVIVHNKFAERPLPFGRLGIPDARHVGGDKLEREGGKSLGELLGLPLDWPSE